MHPRRHRIEDDDGDRNETWTWIRRAGYALSGIVTLAILASTCYNVVPTDRAIVQRVGAYTRTESSGLHGRAPWPFESRHSIPTQNVRRLEMGYRTVGEKTDPTGKRIPDYKNIPEEVMMMTKDENLAIVEFSVQYDVKDPFMFLFNTKEPDNILHDISQAAMRRIVAQEDIDFVLLTGKPGIQVRAKEEIQRIADNYGTGIRVLAVQLGDVRPPPEVKPAFDDVQKAAENREQIINEARAYANKVVPEAKGSAYRIEQEAQAYRFRVVNQAKGDADRFLQIWEQYRKEPDITKRQLYIQNMNAILGKYRKVIIDSEVPINIFMGERGR